VRAAFFIGRLFYLPINRVSASTGLVSLEIAAI
jgi:hypothetical protein